MALRKAQTGGSIKKTAADRKAYAEAQRAKRVKAVKDSAGNPRLQNKRIAELKKADNAVIKTRKEGGSTGKRKTTYTKTGPNPKTSGAITITKTKNAQNSTQPYQGRSKTKTLTTSSNGASKITKKRTSKTDLLGFSHLVKNKTKSVSKAKAKRVTKRFTKKMKKS